VLLTPVPSTPAVGHRIPDGDVETQDGATEDSGPTDTSSDDVGPSDIADTDGGRWTPRPTRRPTGDRRRSRRRGVKVGALLTFTSAAEGLVTELPVGGVSGTGRAAGQGSSQNYRLNVGPALAGEEKREEAYTCAPSRELSRSSWQSVPSRRSLMPLRRPTSRCRGADRCQWRAGNLRGFRDLLDLRQRDRRNSHLERNTTGAAGQRLFTVYLGQVAAMDLSVFRDHTNLWLGIRVALTTRWRGSTSGARPTPGSRVLRARPSHTHDVSQATGTLQRLRSRATCGWAQSCSGTEQVVGVDLDGQILCGTDSGSAYLAGTASCSAAGACQSPRGVQTRVTGTCAAGPRCAASTRRQRLVPGDLVLTTGSYADPSWIGSIPGSR